MKRAEPAFIFLFCLFTLTGAACFSQAEGGNQPANLSIEHQTILSRLLPDPASFSGKTAGNPLFFSHDLWDYIDGGADAYQGMGFQALVHQDYTLGHAELTVDIYDMGNPVQAFGMYAMERAPEYQFMNIGLQGYGDEFGLNFFQGQYYVKLGIFGEDDSRHLELLTSFAGDICGRIGLKGDWPLPLSWFPDSLRIAYSEKYIRQAPMGHAFLSPVYSVQYASNDSVSALWLSVSETPADAFKRAEELAAHFRRTGSVEQVGEGWLGQNEYEGMMIFITRGPYLAMLQNPFHGADLLLSILLERIP